MAKTGVPLLSGSQVLSHLVSRRIRQLTFLAAAARAGPDSNTAAILAVSLASIGLDTRAKGGSESAVIGTVLMALSATLLVTGAVAYGLGRLREGGLIQLAPFSVVGGVLAASGFLVFSLGFVFLALRAAGSAATVVAGPRGPCYEALRMSKLQRHEVAHAEGVRELSPGWSEAEPWVFE